MQRFPYSNANVPWAFGYPSHRAAYCLRHLLPASVCRVFYIRIGRSWSPTSTQDSLLEGRNFLLCVAYICVSLANARQPSPFSAKLWGFDICTASTLLGVIYLWMCLSVFLFSYLTSHHQYRAAYCLLPAVICRVFYIRIGRGWSPIIYTRFFIGRAKSLAACGIYVSAWHTPGSPCYSRPSSRRELC